MKVTIIMPAYNSEKYIRAAIESCLCQTYTDIVLLIVNDGSTDRTSEIINEYEKKDVRVRHIYQRNQGLVRARKNGVFYSDTDFFVFLDSDDTLSPNAIEELVLANEDQRYDVVFSNFYVEFENGKLLRKSNNDYNNVSIYSQFANRILSKRIAPTIWGKLIRKDLFQKTNTPDNITIGEDAVAILQILAQKPKVGCVDSAIYHYIQHPNSMVNIVDDRKNKQRVLLIETLVNMVPQLFEPEMMKCLKQFVFAEIFTFLRDGGLFTDIKQYYHFCREGTSINELSVIGNMRLFMVMLFSVNEHLGKTYRTIFNAIRNVRNGISAFNAN